MKAELVAADPSGIFHGEGAFWDDTSGAIRFVDMLRGDVLTATAAGLERRHVSDVTAVLRSRRRGGFVIATERGFALTDGDFGIEQEIPVFTDPDVRMNEGACDAAGRFYCGSMAFDSRDGGGRMYRLDPDLSVHVVMPSVTVPNGLVWNATGDVALHADTGEGVIWTYEFDAGRGEFGSRHPLVRFDGAAGLPDGMSIDEEGGIWVAVWGGGAVHRYSPAGALDLTVDLPVSNVTSCAFGGSDRRTLFITTSQQGLSEPEPLAGSLFAAEVGVAGAPVHTFAG
ncbi:SMP-30/gluconolactonase/LRE family protein [Microbacterium timonense]|uniref:SMP-30/gluconolactonase/LRE family protein n=1 Tax=Microbacterium timonense TaxID=2086576 RepID=UPI000D1100A8|nr:SMP-30/gluconolactonase/LRE family protein [Microbacterium timonense]